MWLEIKPDDVQDVAVDGHTVKTYSFGSGDNVVLCANGGPGLPCDYLRDSHSCLAGQRYRAGSGISHKAILTSR